MPFVKGQSGNPKGRPKGKEAFSIMLDDYLSDKSKGDKLTRRQRVVEKLYEMAMEDDIHALKYLIDRDAGKVIEKIELEVNTFSDWVKSLK